MSLAPWESTLWATLLLCSHVTTQLHIQPAPSPSSSNSFPAWLPPVRTLFSPEIPFPWQPSCLPLQCNTISLSFSVTSSALVQPTLAFQSLLLLFPSSLPGPSIPEPRLRTPLPQGTSSGGLQAHTHHCQPGSASGELQGEQSQESGMTGHPMPCRAARLPAPWVLLGGP